VISAAADLARRTGTPLTLHGDAAKLRGRTVTLVAEKVTVWQAVQLFCHRADLHEWDGLSSLPAAVGLAGDVPAPAEGVQVVGQMLVRRGQVSALTVPSPAARVALLDGTGLSLPTQLAGAVRVRALPPGVPFAAEVGKDRLVGRYLNLDTPSDSTPWVGLIVGGERIDGQWAMGRWDLRRKLAGK